MAEGVFAAFQAAIGASTLARETGGLLIRFLEQSSRILAPVYLGDTSYPGFKIADLAPRRTTVVMTPAVTVPNQNAILIADGQRKDLMRLG